jgi:hypothetical protein
MNWFRSRGELGGCDVYPQQAFASSEQFGIHGALLRRRCIGADTAGGDATDDTASV